MIDDDDAADHDDLGGKEQDQTVDDAEDDHIPLMFGPEFPADIDAQVADLIIAETLSRTPAKSASKAPDPVELAEAVNKLKKIYFSGAIYSVLPQTTDLKKLFSEFLKKLMAVQITFEKLDSDPNILTAMFYYLGDNDTGNPLSIIRADILKTSDRLSRWKDYATSFLKFLDRTTEEKLIDLIEECDITWLYSHGVPQLFERQFEGTHYGIPSGAEQTSAGLRFVDALRKYSGFPEVKRGTLHRLAPSRDLSR